MSFIVYTPQKKHLLSLSLLFLLSIQALSGCAVVKVNKNASVATKLVKDRATILDRLELSMPSQNMLESINITQRQCLDDVQKCQQSIEKSENAGTEAYMATVSEIYLARAKELALSNQCRPVLATDITTSIPRETFKSYSETPLASAAECIPEIKRDLLESARYAYTYLLFGKTPWSSRSFEDRHIQVRDFYNVAVSRLVQMNFPTFQEQLKKDNGIKVDNNLIELSNKTSIIGEGNLPQQLLANLFLNFQGMRVTHKRDGFGASFVAVLPPQKGQETATDTKIVQSQYIPLTITLRPKGATPQQILATNDFKLEVYNPLETGDYQVNQNLKIPLAADYSAPYGLWLAQTPLAQMALTSLVRSQTTFSPILYMVAPYDPKKKVIIMIHGLASSPEAWVSLTNDILGDPQLREKYQVWQVFYPTRNPMLESRYEIAKLIKQAYQTVDPSGRQAASRDSVIIGHSMGGVISRLLLSNDDLSKGNEDLLGHSFVQQSQQYPGMKERFVMSAIPNISRAIFIASPFRGTPYTERWFTRGARKIIGAPVVIIKAGKNQLTNLKNGPENELKLQTESGASELAVNSKFMKLTSNVKIIQGLPYHLIMGAEKQIDPITATSDGIVPYTSSHLDGAVSEKVIFGNHSVQETPEAVLELRRILREHLKTIKN